MRRLILMRHAEADAPKLGMGDHARPLSRRGEAEARAMGRLLSARGWRPDVAIVSPAVRTQQTWDLVRDAFGDVDLRTPSGLYNADASRLDALIADVADEAGCLIVIAHNPGVHVLAVQCLQDNAAAPADLERFADGFPTGAAAVFTVDETGRRALDSYLQPPAAPE